MDLLALFTPANLPKHTEGTIGSHIFRASRDQVPEWENYDLALFTVAEQRGSYRIGSEKEIKYNGFRHGLYKLYPGDYQPSIIDLGELSPGETVEDTYAAIRMVMVELINRKIVPIIIGAGQDLTFGMYQAYEELEKVVNLVTVDARLDLGKDVGPLSDGSYIGHMILRQPNYLFNYCNLGHQQYYVHPEEQAMVERLYFDIHRLGEVRGNIHLAEPMVRTADFVSFDCNSIRNSDFKSSKDVQPNGFYAEEICQLARYAGTNENLSSCGIFGCFLHNEIAFSDDLLIAEIVWCFIDGFYQRKQEFPFRSKEDYLKYRVSLQDDEYEIIFYKSLKTDRWWMEVPFPPSPHNRYARQQIIPCSYEDYMMASRNEIPDRWWRTYQKLS